jgi:hypothetical protein
MAVHYAYLAAMDLTAKARQLGAVWAFTSAISLLWLLTRPLTHRIAAGCGGGAAGRWCVGGA